MSLRSHNQNVQVQYGYHCRFCLIFGSVLVGVLSQIKLLFGLLVIQLVWCILFFTLVEVSSGGYLPTLR